MPAADAAAQEGVAADRAALEAFYDATGGPDWTDSTNWKTDAPLGEWYGVTTDTAGRVQSLALWENALAGPIPPALGSLTNLRTLYLGGNALSGPIPAPLGNLTNLEVLRLGWNSLIGPIPPELGSLTNLEYLELYSNALTGPIPPELGSLTNLKYLMLGSNPLTGPIPPELGSLTNLRQLFLDWNALAGPIPPELGSLTRLEYLSLGSNALTGPIPPALGSLTNLKSLELRENSLTGPVTAWLGGLTNLEYLGLSYNWGVPGPIPASLSRLSRLNIWMTQACAPAAWRALTETLDLNGALCGAGPATIDVAVVYTPAARRAAGGTAAIEAVIDLMIAETNQAYAEGGVDHLGWTTAWRWWPDPRCRTPSRATTGSISTASRIRRTVTWTRCMRYATEPRPTSSICSSTRATTAASLSSAVLSVSPARHAAAVRSRTSWDTTWACCTTAIRCTTMKAACGRIRGTAT